MKSHSNMTSVHLIQIIRSTISYGFKCISAAGMLICVLFLTITFGSKVHPYVLPQSPFSTIKGAVASVSSSFFIDMLGMELPRSHDIRPQLTFSHENMILFVFRLLTNLNPRDPQSLLAAELPGMAWNQTTVLRTSKAPNPSEPIDLEPSPDLISTNPPPTPIVPKSPTPPTVPDYPRPLPAQDARRVAFIYQTHSNESFLPELQGITNPTHAYHERVNITLVGKRLAEQLQLEGVGAVHSDRIYPNVVKDFSYPRSYQYSLQTLKEAMSEHPQLTYFFDIHRDSSSRERTTIHFRGQDYAQIYFIIGGKNSNWKQNEEFANEIHQILEQQAPGLSKGIHAKATKESNGVYNQDISSNSILIEVGGPYNSLAECYRTVDILASAISEVILQVKKVDGTG